MYLYTTYKEEIIIKPLKIGDLVAKVPVIQGGMGIGISRSSLAAAVAKAGGVGVISGVQIGYDEEDFEKNTLNANLRALKKHIIKAKENANGGIIGLNLMVAMNAYEEHVKEAISAGVDLIISGAGLPTKLPSLVKGSKVKIAPIVSTAKAASVILKMWDRKDKTTADLLVVEGPKAGGHLGYSKEELQDVDSIDYDKEFVEILKVAKTYGEKYNKEIPVVAAGGIFTADDVLKYINLGASGVQVGTKFVTTHECDASEAFKNTYVNASEEDIDLVVSPVGMPGRAIHNKFIERVSSARPKIRKCYHCLIPCTPNETPYCISEALISAVKGDVDNALLFCGANAYKVDRLYSVDEVMKELTSKL
ncbi:nitronate monooxygenase family protein [Romboutsia sp.]|uniref:NAD(P)H-dependent flavin oxidoreductase n=1 Tax=Romboutsia sp. TaxID=1965302 RepID=UPI002CB49D3C|nr:nitronate monooxygenase family protein [Romboutsia sp.]HSQ87644.1 nitronate monooxygenase family protein [Romboutsia sp.]